MNQSIKLLLVDDHQLFIEGLESIIKDHPFVQIVGNCSDGDEVLTLLDRSATLPDIIISDINMRRMTGFCMLQQIKKVYPKLKFIFLSVREDRYAIQRLINLGVDGYLFKDVAKSEFILAIQSVYNGQKYFAERAKQILLNIPDYKTGNSVQEKLSTREKEVVGLICEGLTNAQIGQKLYLAESTIITHRKNILYKLQAKNTAELIKMVYEHGLR